MAGKRPLQRIMLNTMIVALAVSGAVGMWAFIFGSFGRTEWKILATTLSVSFFSVTALGCATAQQVRRSRLLWLPGLIASGMGFIVFLVGIWDLTPFRTEEVIFKSMAILALFAFSFSQASLLSLARLSVGARWVFFAALVSIFALATLVSGMILWEVDDEWLFRLAGVLGILDGCLSLTIPLLFKLGYKAPGFETLTEPEVEVERIPLECPRCHEAGTYPVGLIVCPTCGLRLRVEILEEVAFPEGTSPG